MGPSLSSEFGPGLARDYGTTTIYSEIAKGSAIHISGVGSIYSSIRLDPTVIFPLPRECSHVLNSVAGSSLPSFITNFVSFVPDLEGGNDLTLS